MEDSLIGMCNKINYLKKYYNLIKFLIIIGGDGKLF